VAPVTAHPVSRALVGGDVVAGFEVLEVPGTRRVRDRVLVGGGVLANFGLHPSGYANFAMRRTEVHQ
jgi:hypothetical protein